MTETKTSFTLAVTYWPRQRSGSPQIPCSWAAADHGAVRAALAHIAEVGFTRVDLTLRWAEAQPGPARLAMPALNGLERALDAADAVGLQASVDLLGGVFGGALHVPLWAVGYRMLGDLLRARRFGPVVVPEGVHLPPILTDDRYRREPVGDLYGDTDLRAAAAYLVNEVVGGLGGHPALTAWTLGAGMSRVRRPASADAARRWWHDLAALALSRGARTIAGLVDGADLRRAACLRPTAIAAAQAAVGVRALPIPAQSYRQAWNLLDVRFLHALVAALLQSETGRPVPVHIADLGLPTAVEGQAGWVETEVFGAAATLFLADAEQQARFVESALAALHRDGAAGVTLASYADQPASHWGVPPLDRSWLGRTGGIVDAAGNEKAAAAAVRAFATRLRSGALPAPVGPPALPLDPERYWYDPNGAYARLAADFSDQELPDG
jgi:hypothetical protein